MGERILSEIQKSYDRVADEYTRHIFSELEHKPLDRELLTRFAAEVKGHGDVCDMGCGPGHIARYLRDAGGAGGSDHLDVFGLDLSAGMLRVARRLNPDIPFRQGNMLALELPDASLAGIAAFYAVVNLPRESLPQVFREIARVLQPGGLLLLGFHIGGETLHRDDWWERPINMDFHFLNPQSVQRELEAAGLAVEEIVEREPYAPGVEHQCRRAYIFARKLAGLI
jgi:ubiquinone/menaquinone biosynthesis C-methylase UbiE